MTALESVKFDPGWAKYILVYSGSLEYLYADINKYKNFSQRSFKFKQYYPKILILLENNIGFYTGCLLWAVWLKSLPDTKIADNYCLGQTYNNESEFEADYILTSIEKLIKDYKYYVHKDAAIPEIYKIILVMYNEFTQLNEGFVNTKTTYDLKLPNGLKIPSAEELQNIKSGIDKSVETGKLKDLIEFANIIL